MKLSTAKNELLQAMGLAVLALQTTERAFRLCATIVLQRQELTLESLSAQEREEEKKTLGFFLQEIRKRADIHQTFDQLLSDFLKNRNAFIHDLDRVEAWDLSNESGIESSIAFIHKLLQQSDQVTQVLVGLICSWSEQTGLDISIPDHPWFSEAAGKFKELAPIIFRSKSKETSHVRKHK